MRRTVTTLLTGLALVVLAGCGSTEDADPTVPPGTPTPEASGRLSAPATSPSPSPSATSTGPTVTTTTPAIEGPDVLAAIQRRGGMCPDGACGTSLVVTADGGWVRTGIARQQDDSGTLTPAQLQTVEDAVASTTLGDAAKFDGVCPTSYDGQETVVYWRVDGDLHTAASCTVEFPPTDPLIRALTSTVEDLGGPAR